MFTMRDLVLSGALMSYFPDNREAFRRAAAYVARILRGEHAGDLPVERQSKFELFLNARTARILGITLPKALIELSDEVID